MDDDDHTKVIRSGNMNKDRLVRLAQEGDESAIEELCREYTRRGLFSPGKVWTLSVTTRDGDTYLWCASSREIIEDTLYRYVESRWEHARLDEDMPEDAGDAIELFFEETGEMYSIAQPPIRFNLNDEWDW